MKVIYVNKPTAEEVKKLTDAGFKVVVLPSIEDENSSAEASPVLLFGILMALIAGSIAVTALAAIMIVEEPASLFIIIPAIIGIHFFLNRGDNVDSN